MDDRTRAARRGAPAPRSQLEAPGDAFITSWAGFGDVDDEASQAAPPEISDDEDSFLTPWAITVTINITDADSPSVELIDSPAGIPNRAAAAEPTPPAHRS